MISLDNIFKIVSDKEIYNYGLLPLSLTIITVLIIIVITIILVKNEIKGVKNEKN